MSSGESDGTRESVDARCGMPLILLWALQAMIDEGRITPAEAAEMVGRGGAEAP